MGFQTRVVVLLGMLTCLSLENVHAKEGFAIFHSRPYLPTACYGYRDQGIMIAAANPTLYDGGKVCGKRYKVSCVGSVDNTTNPCKGGAIIVRVVDLCTGCGAHEINLSREAFSRIAYLNAGRIRDEYIQV